MRLRVVVAVVVAVVGALALAGASAGVAVASEGCTNEAIREAQHATYLPNCRAYEQVSPASKDNGEVETLSSAFVETKLSSPEGMFAAENGERMAWESEYPLPWSTWPGLDYLSTRGRNGWSTENVIPPQSTENGTNCPGLVALAGYSENLSKSVLADGVGQYAGVSEPALNCGHDEPRLAAGELPNDQNIFLRGNEATPSYRLVDVVPSGEAAPSPEELKAPGAQKYWRFPSFLAGSAHLSTVVFEAELPLTENAPGWPNEWEARDDLYAWSAASGTDSLVSVLPGGKGVLGTLAGSTRNVVEGAGTFSGPNVADSRHAVSANGSRIFFDAEGNLYVRENATAAPGAGECAGPANACTIELDQPHGGTGGGGKFLTANAAGTKVFFTDEASAGLTEHTEAGSGTNLYEYRLPSEAGKPGTLVDLTEKASRADVLGLAGAGQAGEYVYFVAEGKLTGSQQNSHGAAAEEGKPNLYEAHAGELTFIATLDPNADLCDWESPACVRPIERSGASNVGGFAGGSMARVSANGRYIAFNSDLKLTDYANAGSHCVPLSGESGKVEPILQPHGEEGAGVVAYGAGACQEIFLYQAQSAALECASCGAAGRPPVAPALFRFPPDSSLSGHNAHVPNNVADDGAVFFETAQPLVPAASNGKVNVYEYQAGQAHLISSGTSEANAVFLEATPDGSNVFFATNQALVRSDTDRAYDIYDARVEGGFPEPTAPQAPCASEGCKNSGTGVATFSAVGSATFVGAGNLSQQRENSSRTKHRNAHKRLMRALRHCVDAHRHNRGKRRACKSRARRRFAAKGTRHRRHRHGGRAVRRARRHHKHGGKP